MMSTAIVDRARHVLGAVRLHDLLVRTCPAVAAGQVPNPGPNGPPGKAVLHCETALSHHIQQLVTYQPPSHYWPLQALETGIFLATALALIVATLWRVQPRAARKPVLGGHREPTGDPPALELAPEGAHAHPPGDGDNSSRLHPHHTSPTRPAPGSD